jgi:neutral ceramidase
MKGKNVDIYSVGIATGDITPEAGAPLCGFAARGLHTSTGVYHPLRTVAAAIYDGKTGVIILSAEIVFFESIADRVRTIIRQQTGVSDANIILCGTHTHCGPSVRTEDIERHGWIDHDYVNRAISTMARAAGIAWNNRFDARLKFGIGRCDFAVSRRKPDPDNPGRVLWAPCPKAPHDHEVSILAVESMDEILRGVIFSYACHPTSRGGLLIGGDYPGFAYDRIQEVFDNAQPCFLQGCGADQKPVPADPAATLFFSRTIEETRAIGRQLGDSVIETIKQGRLDPVTGAINMRQSVINLSTEPLDKAMVADEMERPEGFKKDWARYHLARIDAGLPEQRTVPFEIQTLRFGDSLAAVALSAEAVVEHALRLKRELRPYFRNVMPIAYANDVVGYIPVKRQFDEGGYEVLDANQYRKRTGRFVKETEDQIHAAVADMLKLKKRNTHE